MPLLGGGGSGGGFRGFIDYQLEHGGYGVHGHQLTKLLNEYYSEPPDSPSAETVSEEGTPTSDSAYYENRINGATDFSSLINAAEKLSADERAFNAAQAELAYERNRALASEAFERARQARLDEYSDMIQSLKRAGLNPYLAFERSPTAVAGYQASAPSASYSGFASSVAGASSSVYATQVGFAKTVTSAVIGALAKIVGAALAV